jgi:hypothetical protein
LVGVDVEAHVVLGALPEDIHVRLPLQLGYVDDEGYIFLTDRIKDMIVSGGENVYPIEVIGRLDEGDAFFLEVWAQPKVMLIGTEVELPAVRAASGPRS